MAEVEREVDWQSEIRKVHANFWQARFGERRFDLTVEKSTPSTS